MSESDPVEIVANAIAKERGDIGHKYSADFVTQNSWYARSVIAALEREGFKLMRREASAEAIRQMNLCGFKAGVRNISQVVFEAAWDASPSYSTAPVETAESG